MNERTPPTLSKTPFLIMDLLLIVGCSWMVWQALPPKETIDHVVLIAGIVGWIFAASLGIYPWIAEFKAQNRFEENKSLGDAVAQIKRLEDVGSRVQAASTMWQGAHDSAAKVVTTAKEIQEKIHADSKDFMGFVERVNSEEKKHLKLELEKMRRAETEFLQVTVRLLDHTFALNQAAARSGQPHLIGQLGNFQNACRDAARRIGLIAFVPAEGEKFDNRAHQTEPPSEPAADATITEVLASGYTFQGQLLRRALVRVSAAEAAPEETAPSTESASVEPEPEPEPAPVEEAAPVEPEPSETPQAEDVAITAPKAQAIEELEKAKPAKRVRQPDPQVMMQL